MDPGGSVWEKGAIGNLIRGIGLDGNPEIASNSAEATPARPNLQSELNSESKFNSNSNSKTPYKINTYSEIRGAGNPKVPSELEINSQLPERPNSNLNSESRFPFNSRDEQTQINSRSQPHPHGYFYARGKTAKELATERELRVGQGPVCGPKGVKPEILERVRQRDAAARAAGGKGK
jgi:hypothetical protein